MANVLFKRGSSANLPLETFQAQDGVFYLTTDTNRLYVGNGTKLAEINRYVKTVANRNALNSMNPQTGDFVYIIEGNILAVYLQTTEGDSWIQVNTQGASVDTYASKIKFNEGVANEAGTATTFTLTLSRQQKDKDGNTTNLDATPDFITSIDIPIINIDLDYEVANNSVLIKTTGNGANTNGTGVTIAGGNGITISQDENQGEVIVSGKSYELALDGTSFDLKDENNSNVGNPIEIIGDDNWINASNDNGKLKISHSKKQNITENSGNKQTLSNKAEISVITGLTADDNNHITGIEKTTLTAQNTTYEVQTSIDNTNENKGKLVVGLKDQENTIVNATPLDISFKVDIDGKGEKNIHPGNSLGKIYSKEEMDTKFKALNAMTYKGVVNKLNDLPITGSIGDTYKVGEAFSIIIGEESVSLKVGDLLILNGNEDENDVVNSPTWDRIESGEAADTTYVLSSSDDSLPDSGPAILLTNSHGDIQSLNFVDDDVINVSTKNQQISITHGKVELGENNGVDTALNAGSKLNTITGITVNEYGHVVSVGTTNFTLPAGDKIVADGQEASLTFKDGNENNQGSIKITAGNELNVAAEATGTSDLTATISHAQITKDDTTGTATPAHGESFNVVESVTYNNYGHVSGIKTTAVQLPAETTYNINTPAVGENNNSVTWELKDSNTNTKGSVKLVSESIKFTADASHNVSMELTWGEF